MIQRVHLQNWDWIKRLGEQVYLVDNMGTLWTEYSFRAAPKKRRIICKFKIKQKK